MTAAVRNGFTLVEVLVALVASSLLVAILMNGALSAKQRGHNQLLANQALSLAHSKIEMLKDNLSQEQILSGNEGKLQWVLQEEEIARDPQQTHILVEAQISVGTAEKLVLASLKKRYLKRLKAR